MSRRRQIPEREPDGVSPTDPVWSRVRDIISLLNASPIMRGRLLTEEDRAEVGSGIALTAGVIRAIPHKLGRPALGFFEVCGVGLPASGGCDIMAAPYPTGTTNESYISLRANTTGRTWIWVF